jgi:hypothetical protein
MLKLFTDLEDEADRYSSLQHSSLARFLVEGVPLKNNQTRNQKIEIESKRQVSHPLGEVDSVRSELGANAVRVKQKARMNGFDADQPRRETRDF